MWSCLMRAPGAHAKKIVEGHVPTKIIRRGNGEIKVPAHRTELKDHLGAACRHHEAE